MTLACARCLHRSSPLEADSAAHLQCSEYLVEIVYSPFPSRTALRDDRQCIFERGLERWHESRLLQSAGTRLSNTYEASRREGKKDTCHISKNDGRCTSDMAMSCAMSFTPSQMTDILEKDTRTGVLERGSMHVDASNGKAKARRRSFPRPGGRGHRDLVAVSGGRGPEGRTPWPYQS